MFAGLARPHRQRVAHRLQRLQGRRLHPHRAPRAQARQEGHPHRREALRGPRHRPHRQGDGRRARDRHARPPRLARAPASGPSRRGEHAKFGLSTAEILEAAKILDGGGHEPAPSSSSTSTSARRSPTSSSSSAPCARPRATTRSSARWGTRSSTSTSAAASPSTTTARARTFHSSMNYSVEEYARDVVWNITDVCDEEQVPHPHIVSESGRAIVAHHSRARRRGLRRDRDDAAPSADRAPQPSEHKLIKRPRRHRSEHLSEREPHRVVARSPPGQGGGAEDVRARPPRARREGARRDAVLAASPSGSQKHRRAARSRPRSRTICGDLESELADQHICNFSVFQSLLDHWAFGALFPIVPIHRLERAAHARRARSSTSRATRTARSRKFIDRTTTCARRCRSIAIGNGAVLPRHLPDRRLPGHHGRHPQPLRPRQRGARLPR